MTNENSFTVLALSGSLRGNSCNRRLLAAAQECALANLHIKIDDILGTLPLFNEDLERDPETLPAAVTCLRRHVAEADGLLIATPEYNQSLPGVLKNAIDWLSRPLPDEVLVGKPVALIGASTGRWGTRLAQSALRHTLNATEALVMPAPGLYVREAETLFDATGHLTDQATRDALQSVLKAFAAWMVLTKDRHDDVDLRPQKHAAC